MSPLQAFLTLNGGRRFPLQEYGVNYEAQPLQKHEIASMKTDPAIIDRLKRSYRMMLGFYGMELVSYETGELRRATNWQERYRNLVGEWRHSLNDLSEDSLTGYRPGAPHNYLRISRILKCLSEFGLEHLNAGFLLFVLSQQSEHRQLCTQMLCNSMDKWWANCVRNEQERKWINEAITRVRENPSSVFSEDVYRAILKKRKETAVLQA